MVDEPWALARRIVQQRLESLQRAGVTQLARASSVGIPSAPLQASSAGELLPLVASTEEPVAEQDIARAKPATSAVSASTSSNGSKLSVPYPTGGPQTTEARTLDLANVCGVVSKCTLCKELAATRTQTVFGVGNVNARVVFFGEAPGADEDRLGEPFVGRAGQLLTKIIEACGWSRQDVYIQNVLKCRPPENRTPLPAEIDNCRQYFERQFEVIRPEYIVCVGTVPAQALLETTEAVGKLRGRFHKYRDSTVLVTYHPSYLLRNPAAKKFVWEDMQMLLKEMGLDVPGKK